MEKRVLAIIRVSTDVQDTEGQKAELTEFLKTKGFEESEIEYLEAVGASARKANRKYLDFLQTIKDRTGGEDGIKNVAMWHMNRLGRVKYYLGEMEKWFVDNGIQMYVKNGFGVPLLDADGKETVGASIAFSVYSALVEADTEELFAKARRGKRMNAEQGNFNGGKVHFGYRTEGMERRKRVVVDDGEAELVKLLFNLYDSGEYSTPKLAEELQARGYKLRDGKPVTLHFVTNMLKSTAFIGYKEWNGEKRKYPRIVSDKLFMRVQERLRANHKGGISRQSKRISLCTKLIVCPSCGRHWYANNRTYCCIGNKYRNVHLYGFETCRNTDNVSVEWCDVAVWHVAKTLEELYVMNETETKGEEAKKQIGVNLQKIEELKNRIGKVGDRQKKIAENYEDGIYTKDERDGKLAKVKSDIAECQRQIVEFEEDNQKLADLVTESDGYTLFRFSNPARGIHEDAEDAYRIIHRHIKKVTVTPYEHKGKMQKMIEITPYLWKKVNILYIPKCKEQQNGIIYKLFRQMEDGSFQQLPFNADFVLSWTGENYPID